LYFAQAVGRFVRARRKGETASIFVPSVPGLLALAADLEAQRDHVIGRPVKDAEDLFAAEADLLAKANEDQGASDQLGEYRALGSDASFDRMIYDGGEFGYDALSDDEGELDFLGIPGLLDQDQVAELLRTSRAKRAKDKAKDATAPAADVAYEKRSELRRELHGLVGAWHRRTGAPHGVTHSRLRQQCGGPPAAQASAAQLQERIDAIRTWALKASG
jgi:hypothetical protein